MRLGFYYHIPAIQNDHQIVVPGYFGCFIDSLAACCEKVTCFFHSPSSRDNFCGDYVIHHENVIYVNIGPHTSVPHRTLFEKRFVQPFIENRDTIDALLVRGPSPLLPAFVAAAGNLPAAILLVGDYLAGVNYLPQPIWRKELIRIWAAWYTKRQLKAAKQSLTFVNSRLLYDQLKSQVPNLVETRTTTLNETDFFYRDDTCQKTPYHLLYTGRMDRTKGLLEIVEALVLVVQFGYDCVLDLVGMIGKGDHILSEIELKANQLGVADRVVFHGYKPLGPELFKYYRQADIYLIASKSSFEGFPRTIWEAMANSLPVVATRVGSIPGFIEDAAELVEPNNCKALAEAIVKLINDSDRRKHQIQAGLQLAHQNTLERRSLEIVKLIEEYFSNKE